MKELLNKYIDGISKEILAMADSIFDDPELGLNEFRAMKKITDFLEKNGFEDRVDCRTLKEIRQAREYERFLLKNHKESIANGVKTFLILDSFVMDDETTDFYSSLEDTGKLYIKSYSDLLQQAKQYNKDYITRYKEIESIYKPDKEV